MLAPHVLFPLQSSRATHGNLSLIFQSFPSFHQCHLTACLFDKILISDLSPVLTPLPLDNYGSCRKMSIVHYWPYHSKADMSHKLGYLVIWRSHTVSELFGAIYKSERAEVEHDNRQVLSSSLSSQQLSRVCWALTLGILWPRAKEPNRYSFPHTVGLVCL